MSDNISWAKDMSGYTSTKPIKKQAKTSVTTTKVVTKSNEELLSMIDEVTSEFEKKYKQEPTVELGNCIVNLNSIKLD